MVGKSNSIVMEEVRDAEKLAAARAQRVRFDRNTAWLQANLVEVYPKHRGKVICVAGEELFVGDTATEAIALAKSAHPDDDGFFTRYIPKERLPRIYAL
ncbi:MAG: hypothetical protein BMS9Abin37_3010 [Acidobacteriota bacterium]|nr:MAG: hypothetical protein BMS9Abin37_3010 [Acidobacteriota bacterium]